MGWLDRRRLRKPPAKEPEFRTGGLVGGAMMPGPGPADPLAEVYRQIGLLRERLERLARLLERSELIVRQEPGYLVKVPGADSPVFVPDEGRPGLPEYPMPPPPRG